MNADALFQALQASGGAPVCQGQVVEGLDLRGRVIEVPLNLSGALIQGPVDLSGAELRGGLLATRTRFLGGLNARRARISGDVLLQHAHFDGPVDFSWCHVRGRVYAWRARFLAEARFRQLVVSPGAGMDQSFVWPGETNFSWAWFRGQAVFERCYLEGPAYFWRTRFLGAASFDDTTFCSDANFMGRSGEICLSREEMDPALFDRLLALGILQADDEEVILLEGRELPVFAQLPGAATPQELEQRLAVPDLTEPERSLVRALYREHSGPMFAGGASLCGLRIQVPRQVRFIALNSKEWHLTGTDLSSIAFFDAENRPVPANVGMGHAYERVFISYGGPDQATAARFNGVLKNLGVDTYFYPEDSVPGRVITEEMGDGVGGYDRVMLLCSRTSPERPGWRFELQRALEREVRQGRPGVLILVALDDGLWRPWPAEIEPARQTLLGRTVADFRGALDDEALFNGQLARVLAALSKEDGSEPASPQSARLL